MVYFEVYIELLYAQLNECHSEIQTNAASVASAVKGRQKYEVLSPHEKGNFKFMHTKAIHRKQKINRKTFFQ